jgi:hypothetical protein
LQPIINLQGQRQSAPEQTNLAASIGGNCRKAELN